MNKPYRAILDVIPDNITQECKKRTALKHKCGIVEYWDTTHKRKTKEKEYSNHLMTNSEFIRVTSQYKSLRDYDNDKFEAESLISNNQDLPADLEKRLVITKNELIKAGIYKQEWFIN